MRHGLPSLALECLVVRAPCTKKAVLLWVNGMSNSEEALLKVVAWQRVGML